VNYKIRTAVRHEISTVIGWAKAEGWNPGIYDADTFFSSFPDGFLVGLLDGKPVSFISAVSYGNAFGFIGLYIVSGPYRGRGYGLKIWNRAIAKLSGRNVGLDGVTEQQNNYKKSGFRLAYRNIRFQGNNLNMEIDDGHILPLSLIPIKQVSAYDHKIFPAERPLFLKAWLTQPQSLAIGYVKNGALQGYGLIRPCQSGFKIGPLFAETEPVADKLLAKLMQYAPNDKPVFLDVPEINRPAVLLAGRYKMKPVFETARMYSRNQPDVPIQKVFGVTSFEFG